MLIHLLHAIWQALRCPLYHRWQLDTSRTDARVVRCTRCGKVSVRPL